MNGERERVKRGERERNLKKKQKQRGKENERRNDKRKKRKTKRELRRKKKRTEKRVKMEKKEKEKKIKYPLQAFSSSICSSLKSSIWTAPCFIAPAAALMAGKSSTLI